MHQKIPQNKKNCYFGNFWANSNHGNTKNQEIRPQDLDLGGSTASNQANLRPPAQRRSSVLIIAQNLIKR